MCSFLVFNWLVKNIAYVNHFLKCRGPDLTNQIDYKGFMFLHNLLHLTGEVTEQPFVDQKDRIVCLFNGEIYNYKSFGNYKSDGYCLIDCYKRFGKNFITKLDGEFAIILFDFKHDLFFISTDVFGTKPLWYALNDGKLGISTYESGLERAGLVDRTKLHPNTTKVFRISNFRPVDTRRVFTFDFRQYKTGYDGWCKAFVNAIRKRADNSNYPIFVCMSSGYDSGAICAALNGLRRKFYTYTIMAAENIETVRKRGRINESRGNAGEIVQYTKTQFKDIGEYVQEHAERFVYDRKTVGHGSSGKGYKVVADDQASIGMSKICSVASSRRQRIYLSGSGADEIHSDYGKNGKAMFNHSCFGGKWPDNLSTILSNDPEEDMVWKSFYHGTQRDYLAKEEIISGLHGIEGRYPYLDKYVVQEFLWLAKELKNNVYKAPLDYFMTRSRYPFDKGVKKGFRAGENLK